MSKSACPLEARDLRSLRTEMGGGGARLPLDAYSGVKNECESNSGHFDRVV